MTSTLSPRRTLLSLALCVVSLLLLTAPTFATTVLALIDKKHHRVVLAGDSLVSRTLAKDSADVCKTFARPGCSFGIAGLLAKSYPAFQLKDLADQACQLPGDLSHRADAFLDIAKEPMTAVAQYIRQNEPQFYSELMNANGGELVVVIFVGTENGHSAIYARGYKLDPKGGIKPLINDVTEDKQGVGFFAGANQAIAAYIKANKKWEKMDKVTAAKKFVQMEIDAHPTWVGPPISILTVNHLDQEKWVSKGVCDLPPPLIPTTPQTEPSAAPPAPQTAPPTEPSTAPQSAPSTTPPTPPTDEGN